MNAKLISEKLAEYGLEDRELVEVRVTSPTPYNRFSGFGIEMPELGNEDFTVYAILKEKPHTRKDLRSLVLSPDEVRACEDEASAREEVINRYNPVEPILRTVEPQPAIDADEENKYPISEDVPEEIEWLDDPDEDEKEPDVQLPFDSNDTAITDKKLASLTEALKQAGSISN